MNIDLSHQKHNRALAILIPMYNEAHHAEKCVRAIYSVIQGHFPKYQLFVVNDGSQDDTHKILNHLQTQGLPFVLIQHPINKGYGAALITATRMAFDAGYEYGLFMDSDLTNDPALIPTFAEKLSQDQYDLVKASRYIKKGGMQGVPFYRRLFSIIGNKIASRLFCMGIKDCTNGFRAVRLSFIYNVQFKEDGFPIILEELLLLKKKGARATEIPYILTARNVGEKKSQFSYSIKTIFLYLKYALNAAVVCKK